MHKHIIGIDIGGTMIKGALFDRQGVLIKKESVPTADEGGQEQFIETIVSLAAILGSAVPAVASIGIGIAGVLDAKRTTLLESPNLPRLHELQLKQMLESKISVPVLLENDANCAALGELWAGAGRGVSNFLFFTLGTGIGSGLILNGRLWTGEQGKAGEFGHIIVNPLGALCACGKQGCLEAHASGSAITRMACEALARGDASSLQSLYRESSDALTPERIYLEARNGDVLCNAVYREAAQYLAIGIANVNNLLDIHTFIIGGGVSKAMHLVETYLLEEVTKRVFEVSRERIRISVSQLGNDAGVYGAGYMALHGLSQQE